MKIALVHDWLNFLGGAERVLVELHKIFPDAPIYTLFYNKKFKAEHLPGAEIRSSFLQRIPCINKHYKYTALLMPGAIESFDLSDFDVIISSSVFFSKGLILRPKTRHICYCYSPTRQLWDLHFSSTKHSTLSHKLVQHLLRLWDRQAADRVDEFVAISETVSERIRKYYKRDARVIYPPCNINPKSEIRNLKAKVSSEELQWESPPRQIQNSTFKIPNNYYLIVSRLYPHKNIDIAIEAFNKLNLPLVIIGDGPEKRNLKSKILNLKLAQMIGFVPDEELPYYYQHCRAFIMPQEEDFGITSIEAMSFGKPVLALRKGGALETTREGVTGEFFDDPIPEALADGVRRLNENYQNYKPDMIKTYVQKFSTDRFKKEIIDIVRY